MVEQLEISKTFQETPALSERLKNVPGSLLCVGLSGEVEDVNNEALEKFFGFPRAIVQGRVLIGARIADLDGFPERKRVELEEALEKAREGEKPEVVIGGINK